MALSRAAFGQRGDLFPGALLWVVRWGWETVNPVIGSYALPVAPLPRPAETADGTPLHF